MRMAKLYLGVLGLAASAILLNCCIPTREASCNEGKVCNAGEKCNLETQNCEAVTAMMEPPEGEMEMLTPECTSESSCAVGLACLQTKCQKCTRHKDCESQVCELGSNATGQSGCLLSNQVVYVRSGTGCDNSQGTQEKPTCTVNAALLLIATGSRGSNIRLLGNQGDNYRYQESVNLGGKTISIYGPSSDGATAVVEAPSGNTLTVDATAAGRSAKVLLDGFTISSSANGVVCVGTAGLGSDLTLRRMNLENVSDTDISASRCTLTLSSTQVRANRKGALTLSLGTQYEITNTVFIGSSIEPNLNPLITIDSISNGRFVFNTVIDNRSNTYVVNSIDCGISGYKLLQNSILLGLQSPKAALVSVNCHLDYSLLSPKDFFSETGSSHLLSGSPSFASPGDYHLSSTADQACCMNQIPNDQAQGITQDIDGDRRPSRGSLDVGADEVP